jgi:hypothetical protein
MRNILSQKIAQFASKNSPVIKPFKKEAAKGAHLNRAAILLCILFLSKHIFPFIIPFDTIQGYAYFGEKKFPSEIMLINNSTDSVTMDSIKIELPFQCEEVFSINMRFFLDSADKYIWQNHINQGICKFASYDTVIMGNFSTIVWVSSMPPFQCSPSGTIIRDSNFVVPIILYFNNSNDTVCFFGRITFMTPDGVLYTPNTPKKKLNSPNSISDKMTDLSGRKLAKDAKGLIISNNKKSVILKNR